VSCRGRCLHRLNGRAWFSGKTIEAKAVDRGEDLAQMNPQPGFREPMVARRDRLDDRVMLLDQTWGLLRHRQAQHADPIQFDLALLDHAPDAGTPGKRRELPVQRLIEGEEAIRVGSRRRRFLLGNNLLQGDTPGLVDPHGEIADHGAFQMLADKLAFAHRLEPDWRDEASGLRIDLDQPLVSKPKQGLAQGRAADTDVLHERRVGEPAARWQLRLADHRPKSGVGAIGESLARVGRLGCHGGTDILVWPGRQ